MRHLRGAQVVAAVVVDVVVDVVAATRGPLLSVRFALFARMFSDAEHFPASIAHATQG
jgi:hypothetical protein